jgi:ABC-type nitrate/sulfonate/bicarbonate transport system permease component
MSGLSLRLTEIRSFLLPVSQFAAWPIFFLVTSVISQQPAYFLALFLVLAADLIDKSPGKRGLFRDLVAGGATTLLALFLTDLVGVAVGTIVAVVATARLVQKLS